MPPRVLHLVAPPHCHRRRPLPAPRGVCEVELGVRGVRVARVAEAVEGEQGAEEGNAVAVGDCVRRNLQPRRRDEKS